MIDTILQLAILALVTLALPMAYRGLRGPDVADRLLAIDMITTLLLGVIVLVALLDGESFLIDLGIATGAIAFIGTLGIVRYVIERKVF